MAQQINLYNPELRRQRVWLSLANIAAVALLLALLLAGAGAALRAQIAGKQQEAQALDAELGRVRARMTQIGSDTAQALAEAELKSMQETLAARREVLAALDSGAGIRPDATTGFAEYMRGLARQTVSGLWLTGFTVRQGGEGMEIRGRMLVADRLPDYIRRLNGEKVFRGRQFVSLQVDRPVDGDPQKAAALTPFNSFVLTAVQVKDDGKAGAR